VNGKTIAVLGNGLNVNYPKDNEVLQKEIENNGLVVSEYPNNVEAHKDNFPVRNRIVAGLSDAIIVSEAKRKSGTMITVSRALEMGKDIFCVPYKIGEDSGCNSLIKEGAKLIETHEDVLNEL
jgi:DNA processing protein